jgi:hypothetical protein
MSRRNWGTWVLLFVFAFIVLSGGCGGGGNGNGNGGGGGGGGGGATGEVIPGDHVLEDIWEPVPYSTRGEVIIDGADYTLGLHDMKKLSLNIQDSGNSGAGTVRGKIDIELVWDVAGVLDGDRARLITTAINDPAATLSFDGIDTYTYLHEDTDTTLSFTLHNDGEMSLRVRGKDRGDAYEASFTASGFLAALEGTWICSNGKISGKVEGISGTGTLNYGTATLSILSVSGNVVTCDLYLDTSWTVSGGGYTEEDAWFGTEGSDVSSAVMERVGANSFRFVYRYGTEIDTVEITLARDRQAGKVRYRYEDPEYDDDIRGTFDIKRQ